MSVKSYLFTLILLVGFLSAAKAQETAPKETKYNPSPAVMHHIGDAHEFHIVGDLHLPLPCILYAPDKGFSFFLSSAFHHGSKIVDGYAIDHSVVRRVVGFPVQQGEVELEPVGQEEGETSYVEHRETDLEGGKKLETGYIKYQGQEYALEESSKLMKTSSWYDFSITKNVFTMLMVLFILFFVFLSVKNAYIKREGQAPSGLQGFVEPFFVFIRDEVAKPSIGHNYERYMPFIMSLFFFILINNLVGLVPFFPFGANVMGNISSTIVLALLTFLVVNLSGNKNYWSHIFWMPDVPVPIKVLMAPIEFASLFIKPFTLLIRLFANITAGHTIILSLVSLIFVFGHVGESISGAGIGALVAVPFVAFMNLLELLVAFLQAFIFALLTSLYIGAAIEEHH